MKKLLSIVIIFLAAFSSLSITVPVANAVEQTELTDIGKRAFEDLTRCINTKHILNVYYLVDQSDSLVQTDPDKSRAEILASSLRALGSFNTDVEVNYAVGFFGSKFDAWKGWTRVNSASVSSEAKSFAAEVRTRDKQSETNWLKGIDGASKLIAQQQKKTEGCQALIWLTDGGLWIHKPGAAINIIDQEAVDEAAGILCSTKFDELRSSNVSVFGVLLKNDTALRGLAKRNPTYFSENDRGMQYMRPLIEGKGDLAGGDSETVCGRPLQDSFSAGALLIAKDPVALALQFMILTGKSEGGIFGNLTAGNPTSFVIERGVRKFQLLTTSKDWTLTSPTGVTYNPGNTSIEIQNLSGVQQIIVKDDDIALGKWVFDYDKNIPVINKLLLFSGLDIKLDPIQLIAGKSGTIAGQVVVQGSGKKVNLKDYIYSFSVSQVLSTGTTTSIPASISDSGVFSVDFKPTASQAKLELRTTLILRTLTGQELAPVSISKFMDIHLPDNYPTLDLPIKLSDLKGSTGIATGTATLHGPLNGDGKICLSSDSQFGIGILRDSPKRKSGFEWSVTGLDENNCVSIKQGALAKITISATNKSPADSSVIADLPVNSISDKELGKTISFKAQINFNSSLLRAPALPVKLFLFFMGIGIPLLMLYLLNKLTAKLIFGTGIQRAEYPIIVDATRGILTREKSQLNPVADDFIFIPQQPDTVSFTDRIGQLRARVSMIPFVEPWYEAESISGYRILSIINISNRLKKRFISGQISPIKPDMGNFWAIQIAEKDLQNPQHSSAVPALLVVYKRNKVSMQKQHADRILEVIKTPGIWARLQEMKSAQLLQLKSRSEKEETKTKKFRAAKEDGSLSQSGNTVSPPPPIPSASGGKSVPLPPTIPPIPKS